MYASIISDGFKQIKKWIILKIRWIQTRPIDLYDNQNDYLIVDYKAYNS